MEALLKAPKPLFSTPSHFLNTSRKLSRKPVNSLNLRPLTFPAPKFKVSQQTFSPKLILNAKLPHFTCSATANPTSFQHDPSNVPAKFLGVEISTLKKVIPLGLMFFCILFNYTILRDTKDVLVVTAKGSSAEIIPFLKTWVNLPTAIGFMIVYNKLSDILSREALFYTCMLPFIAFFGLFAFVLYPNINLIHPIGLADRALEVLGPSFLGPIAIFRIWSFCVFYVMAELWGSVVVSLLFWGYANQVSSIISFSFSFYLFNYSGLVLIATWVCC